MKKLTNWLIRNNFEISIAYNNITNRMTFKKDGKYFTVLPMYNGNNVDEFKLFVGNKYTEYSSDPNCRLLDYCKTQKEMIEIINSLF